jgi:hypothetical protein
MIVNVIDSASLHLEGDALLDLPPHLRDRLVSALESGLLGPSPTLASLRSVLGNREDVEGVAASLVELGRLGISGPAAAAWLRTVEKAAARTRKPDLVWSGPEVAGLHARDTRRVYEELLGSAERSIWASTFAFFDGPKAFEVLARRMEAMPALRVTLLLNIQRNYDLDLNLDGRVDFTLIEEIGTNQGGSSFLYLGVRGIPGEDGIVGPSYPGWDGGPEPGLFRPH